MENIIFDNHFFSIIIVSLNASVSIQRTVCSVLKQTYQNYEIIIKDGVSTDGTLVNIPVDDRIHVYCRIDTGIYNAMNQAIQYSRGKYLLFLNCGDELASENVLDYIHNAILRTEYPDIMYGDYLRKGIFCKQPSNLASFYLYRTPLNHQSIFFSKCIFEKYGMYDTSYRIFADYDFFIMMYLKRIRYQYENIIICKYLGDGISEQQKVVGKAEYDRVIKKYFTKRERLCYEVMLFLSLKKLRQVLASDKSPRWIRNLYRKTVNIVNK